MAEDLLGQMESGDLGLEDSLKAFERGVKLTRQSLPTSDEVRVRCTH